MGETIFGAGLENIDRIEFDSAGLTGAIAVPSTDGGASVGALISVSPDAELTGDALTTFRLITTDGRVSNTVGYIVRP